MYGTPLGESVFNWNLNSAHYVCDESTADSWNSLTRQCIQFIFILRRRSLATCDHSPPLSLFLYLPLCLSLANWRHLTLTPSPSITITIAITWRFNQFIAQCKQSKCKNYGNSGRNSIYANALTSRLNAVNILFNKAMKWKQSTHSTHANLLKGKFIDCKW